MSKSISYNLPIGWKLRLSSEFCESIADGTHDTPKPVETIGVPLYTSKNLTKFNCLNTDDAYLISITDAIEINKRSYVEQYDILFGMIGTIGNPVVIQTKDNPFSVKNVCIFRLNRSKINSQWLYYNLCSEHFNNQIARMLDGSTQKFVPLSTLRNFWIPEPDSDEVKQNIVRILSTVDNLIEKTQSLIDKYTSVKQGMMADLFTRGIDLSGTPETNINYGKLRPSVTEAPELYQKNELDIVPKDWEKSILNHYLKKISQGWSPDCESEPANEGQWGILKTTAVVWEGYEQNANKALPNSLVPRSEYEVVTGDVLMTRAGPGSRVGVVAYVDKTQCKLMLSDKLYRVEPTKRIDKEYLALLLASARVQRKIDATKTGLAESQSNISQDIVKKLIVFLPEIDEQKLVVERMNAASNKINQEKTYLEKLKLQKKGLMQDLLTGIVKV